MESWGTLSFQSPYSCAQSFALTCRITNNVYRERSSSMLLPDLAVLLDFSNESFKVRWWKAHGKKTEHGLSLDDRRKNQILFNTTQLTIETSGGFKKADFVAVRRFLGGRSRSFKKIVVKADRYTQNVKRMVEMFDLECVELEINTLEEEDPEFPQVTFSGIASLHLEFFSFFRSKQSRFKTHSTKS